MIFSQNAACVNNRLSLAFAGYRNETRHFVWPGAKRRTNCNCSSLRIGATLVVGIAVVFAANLASAADIEWVGNQSSGIQSEDGSSFFDANYWLNYNVPGPSDDAIFNVDSLILGEGGPNVYFGDFTRHISGIGGLDTTFFPGQDAQIAFVDVVKGGFTFNLGGQHVDVAPSIDLSALVVGEDSSIASLTIQGGGTLHALSARAGDSSSPSGVGSTGTITVSGTGTTFDDEGYLQIGDGSTTGTVIVQNGATLVSRPTSDFNGSIYVGDAHGSGSLVVDSGSHLTDTTSTFVFANGSLSVLGGSQMSTPELNAYDGAKILVSGLGSTLTTGNIYLDPGASLTVANGGVLQSGAYSITGSVLLNQGSITAASLTLQSGDTLKGIGDITGNVNNSDGLVSPGQSPGVISITGNYSQGSSGVTLLEIGGYAAGTEHDVLNVTGAVLLLGTVEINFINGFVPRPHDHFDLINFGSYSNGSSFTLELNGAPAGFQYSISTADGNFGLDVSAVPEPGSLLLLSTALVAFFGCGLRRGRSGFAATALRRRGWAERLTG